MIWIAIVDYQNLMFDNFEISAEINTKCDWLKWIDWKLT